MDGKESSFPPNLCLVLLFCVSTLQWVFSSHLSFFIAEPQEFNPETSDTAALINHGKNIQAQSASSLDRSLKQVRVLRLLWPLCGLSLWFLALYHAFFVFTWVTGFGHRATWSRNSPQTQAANRPDGQHSQERRPNWIRSTTCWQNCTASRPTHSLIDTHVHTLERAFCVVFFDPYLLPFSLSFLDACIHATHGYRQAHSLFHPPHDYRNHRYRRVRSSYLEFSVILIPASDTRLRKKRVPDRVLLLQNNGHM
jgi:hypothetical protein